MDAVINKHLGSILTTVIASCVIAILASIWKTEKDSEVVRTKLFYIANTVSEVRTDIKNIEHDVTTLDRNIWRQEDQKEFEGDINKKLDKMTKRIWYLEKKFLEQKNGTK